MFFTIGKIAFWCGALITVLALGVYVFVFLTTTLGEKEFPLSISPALVLEYNLGAILVGVVLWFAGAVLRGVCGGKKEATERTK